MSTSLPDFYKHPYDVLQIPVPPLAESIIVHVQQVPQMTPRFIATFVKNYQLNDWVLRQINYGAETVNL